MRYELTLTSGQVVPVSDEVRDNVVNLLTTGSPWTPVPAADITFVPAHVVMIKQTA